MAVCFHGDERGVDSIVGAEPIAQIAAFRSAVDHAIADLISPPISDLELSEISSSQMDGSGYLAIVIPSSEQRPYMSRSNSEPRFYFRNGHQSTLMEVFQVRDQMLRRAIPKLEFDWDLRIRHESVSTLSKQRHALPLSLDLILRNPSTTSARFPYLIARVDRARYIHMGPQYQEIAKMGFLIESVSPVQRREILVDARSYSSDWEFIGGPEYCIHPGTAQRIAAVRLEVPVDINEQYADNKLIGTSLQRARKDNHGDFFWLSRCSAREGALGTRVR